MRRALIAALAFVAGVVSAEQKQAFGGYEIHYSVFNPSFLRAEVAERYDFDRGRDKALVNVSVLDGERSVTVPLRGTVKNLLGQAQALAFREVREGEAVYYLATLTYQHQETLRFEITADLPDYGEAVLRFQQTLYWEADDPLASESP